MIYQWLLKYSMSTKVGVGRTLSSHLFAVTRGNWHLPGLFTLLEERVLLLKARKEVLKTTGLVDLYSFCFCECSCICWEQAMTFLLRAVLTRPSLRCEQTIAAVSAISRLRTQDAASGLNFSGMCTATWEIWGAGAVPPPRALVSTLLCFPMPFPPRTICYYRGVRNVYT